VRGRAMPAMFCSRSSKSPSLLAHSAMIDHLYYELGTGGVGTFTVTISYGNMEAQATIVVTPPTDHNIQDQILSLGEALRKGAQSATLFSYPKKPQKLFGAPNLFSPVRVPC